MNAIVPGAVRAIQVEGLLDQRANTRLQCGYLQARLATGQAQAQDLALAKRLLVLGDVIERLVRDLTPHLLTQWLFDIAQAYSKFYTNCPVLKAPEEALRMSRLRVAPMNIPSSIHAATPTRGAATIQGR